MKSKISNLGLEKGLVSIIIPTYNHGHYIRDSIESALRQTYRSVEVIVIDDGSTDDTKLVAENFPVKYIYQRNQGTSAAMNNGIKCSKGEFFITMGADDIIDSSYVAKTLQYMISDKRMGFVYTGVRFFGDRDEVLEPRKLYHPFSILIGGWLGGFGVSLTRRSAFESVNGFDDSLSAYEDLELYTRICLKGWRTKAIFEPLYNERKHWSELAHRHPEWGSSRDIYFRSLLDKKFWYAPLYRKMLYVYELIFERFFFLIKNPKVYFEYISRMYTVRNYYIKYNWVNPFNRIKGIELSKKIMGELYNILSAQVAREPNSILYHKYQLVLLEKELSKLLNNDSHKVDME